jgi:predicted transglutaminase-like cysteine proteinase
MASYRGHTDGDIMRSLIRATLVALALFHTSARADSSLPFGLSTRIVADGAVADRWRVLRTSLRLEHEQLARCARAPELCTREQVIFRSLVAVVTNDQVNGWRFANKQINQLILPVDNHVRFGVPNIWATPLMTLTDLKGDCKDYVILKYAVLLAAGVPDRDLSILIVRDTLKREDHAVLAVRRHDIWYVLDNRTLRILDDLTAEVRYTPLYMLNAEGVQKY